jgi:hypothetical protein
VYISAVGSIISVLPLAAGRVLLAEHRLASVSAEVSPEVHT